MQGEVGFRYSVPWCTLFGLNTRRDIAIVQDYHDGSGRRTLIHFQESRVPLKIDFMHTENLEEFLAGVIDGKVVMHISLRSSGSLNSHTLYWTKLGWNGS